MFDNIRSHYRQLIPSRSGDDQDEEVPLGIYEDEESRAERAESSGEHLTCIPDWLWDSLPNLSFQERLLGCATCMICGYLLSFGSFIRIRHLMGGNPIPLVFTVTAGNILTLCGTCFLSGPQQQSRRMFHPSRKVASVVYLGTLGVTVLLLIVPRFPGQGLLLFLLLLCQYAAITWYCLSYIPFARDVVRRCCRRLVSSVEDDG